MCRGGRHRDGYVGKGRPGVCCCGCVRSAPRSRQSRRCPGRGCVPGPPSPSSPEHLSRAGHGAVGCRHRDSPVPAWRWTPRGDKPQVQRWGVVCPPGLSLSGQLLPARVQRTSRRPWPRMAVPWAQGLRLLSAACADALWPRCPGARWDRTAVPCHRQLFPTATGAREGRVSTHCPRWSGHARSWEAPLAFCAGEAGTGARGKMSSVPWVPRVSH